MSPAPSVSLAVVVKKPAPPDPRPDCSTTVARVVLARRHRSGRSRLLTLRPPGMATALTAAAGAIWPAATLTSPGQAYAV